MSTARKILSNTVAQLLGKIIVVLIGLSVVKITTNYLSVEGYGEYTAVYEFLAFFGIAADLGLFTIAVREMSQDEDKIHKIISNVLSLRLILTVVTMLLAIATVYAIPRYAHTRIPLGVAIASFTVFVTILNGTITSVLQTKLKMHLASWATILGKITSVSFMVYVILWGYPDNNQTGFYMLLIAGNIGNFLMLIVTEYYVRKITPLKFGFDFKLWKEVFIKALPYGIALILSTIYFRVGAIFISLMRGQHELGIYGVATKMLEQFLIIPLYFMNSVLPVLSKSIKEKSEKYKMIIKSCFDFLAALSIPMVVGGVLLAYPIIFIISSPEFLSRLGEGYYGSDIAFQILVFALLFQFLNVLFAFILISVNKQKKLLYINLGCVALNVIINFIFIPQYGFRAAAVASVLSELFILIGTYFAAKQELHFTINFKNLAKITLSAMVMGAAIYLLQKPTYQYIQNWNILLLIPLGMLIYTGMLFATKTIDKQVINLLKKGKAVPQDESV